MLTIAAYDNAVQELFDTLNRVASALARAGIEYRLVGGMAIHIHVAAKHPTKARLTRGVDVAIDRADLERVAEAVQSLGFVYRHAAGVDLLVDRTKSKTRSAVHFVFVREKVRPDDVAPIPDFSPAVTTGEGVLLAPVADLVRMKLISFRLKDQVHIKDLDSVRLITPQIEGSLSPELRDRLRQVRASR